MSILVDTSALYALADADDAHHEAVALALNDTDEPLLVPITVLPEACYLLPSRLGHHAEVTLMESVVSGELVLEQVTAHDLERSLEVMEAYADAQIGFVDASLVAIAERLKLRQIATLDRQDFSIVRPRHCPAFTLLPGGEVS